MIRPPSAYDMTLVVTTEKSGIDRYSQELARRIDVEAFETPRYALAGTPNTAWQILRSSIRTRGVHLPNQHFGRFIPRDGRGIVITVHDVVRLCFPFEPESPASLANLARDVRGIRRAERVICVSEATAVEVERRLAVPRSRLAVISNGHDPDVFRPDSNRAATSGGSTGDVTDTSRNDAPERASLRGLPERFFLFVGSERPRKNFLGLLRAYRHLLEEAGRSGVPRDLPDVVKVGSPGRDSAFRDRSLAEADRLGIRSSIYFVEGISDADLAALYRRAEALVLPSRYEGFGLPVLEAMACGCPVITSDRSALPEVAAGAALLVDPESPASIAAAMRRMVTDRTERERLVGFGFARSRPLTWDACATRTASVYRSLRPN